MRRWKILQKSVMPPTKRGVYAIQIANGSSFKTMYIGSSMCLAGRLSGHSIVTKLVRMGHQLSSIRIKYSTERHEKHLEKKLIYRINPPLNKSLRRTRDIDLKMLSIIKDKGKGVCMANRLNETFIEVARLLYGSNKLSSNNRVLVRNRLNVLSYKGILEKKTLRLDANTPEYRRGIIRCTEYKITPYGNQLVESIRANSKEVSND